MKAVIKTTVMNATVKTQRIATAVLGKQGPPGRDGASNAATDLTGSVDGMNQVFTTAHAPLVLAVFLNGIHQTAPGDYTLSGTTITMTVAPKAGDSMTAFYFY